MERSSYNDCYEILRVPSDVTWNELKLAYRRRLRSCHPDLFVQNPGNDPGAREEEFKRVVTAFKRLAEFRRVTGRLPEPDNSNHDRETGWHAIVRATSARFRKPQDNAAEHDATRKDSDSTNIPRVHRAAFLGFVMGVGAVALAENLDVPSAPAEPSRNGHIAVGMQPREVVDIQGVPQQTHGSVWFYGDAGVIFDKGCVVGWENPPPSPLRTGETSHTQIGENKRRNCSAPVR